jgi:hypothetical protein
MSRSASLSEIALVNMDIMSYNQSQQREEFLMGYPQIILLAFYAVQLAYTMVYHGSEYRINPLFSIVSGALTLALLFMGGFFSVFAIPQIAYILFAIMTTGFAFINKGKEVPINFYGTVITAALLLAWYWAGGFFA